MNAIVMRGLGTLARHVVPTGGAVHRGELLSVQRLRGLAVLMVLIVHIEDIAQRMQGWEGFHSSYSRIIGYSAPDMFFVISGFIMSYITFNQPFEPRRWLVNRFVRIYPMYLFFVSMSVALWMVNPAMTMGSGEHTWATVIPSLFVWPQAGLPLLFVGWTLEHEIVFYAVVFFTAWLLGREWLFRVMTALCAWALLRYAMKLQTGVDVWDWHLGSLFMLQFAMGAFVFKWRDHVARLGWKWPLVACALLLAGGGIWGHPGSINQETLGRVLFFGGSYTALLVAALNHEASLRARQAMPTHRDFLVRVGDASYSIYLSHPFTLATCGKVLVWLDPQGLSQWLVVGLLGVVVLAVGHAVHAVLEQPIIALGKRLQRHPLLVGNGSTS